MMEGVDDKKSARSKWRQSQRYKKYHAKSAPSTLAKQPHRRQQADNPLASNTDRYIEAEEISTKSEGADLLELLSQTTKVRDAVLYNKLRFDLVEDYGMPCKEKKHQTSAAQVLSIKLEGLSMCLQSQPLDQILNLKGRRDAAACLDEALAKQQQSQPQPCSAKQDERVQSDKQRVGKGRDVVEKQLHSSQKQIADDEEGLDLLLYGALPATARAYTSSRTTTSEPQQSLEDWLDGL